MSDKYLAYSVKESIELFRCEGSRPKFVYFIGCPASGRIKVGITDNPKKRFKEIQAMSPAELVMEAYFPVYGQEVETFIHRELAQHRQHGEWFGPHEEVGKFLTEAIALQERWQEQIKQDAEPATPATEEAA